MVELFRSTDPELHDLCPSASLSWCQVLWRVMWGGEFPTLELLAKLLDLGLDPNRPNWIGRTFLHVAAEKGSIEVAEALLEAGADLGAGAGAWRHPAGRRGSRRSGADGGIPAGERGRSGHPKPSRPGPRTGMGRKNGEKILKLLT